MFQSLLIYLFLGAGCGDLDSSNSGQPLKKIQTESYSITVPHGFYQTSAEWRERHWKDKGSPPEVYLTKNDDTGLIATITLQENRELPPDVQTILNSCALENHQKRKQSGTQSVPKTVRYDFGQTCQIEVTQGEAKLLVTHLYQLKQAPTTGDSTPVAYSAIVKCATEKRHYKAVRKACESFIRSWTPVAHGS